MNMSPSFFMVKIIKEFSSEIFQTTAVNICKRGGDEFERERESRFGRLEDVRAIVMTQSKNIALFKGDQVYITDENGKTFHQLDLRADY